MPLPVRPGFIVTTALTTLLTGASALAGPLVPPAGPIAPTYKTLSEVEPRTPVQSLPGQTDAAYLISQPGSYYLTNNINIGQDRIAIRITANDVTLDLNGFAITGPGSSGNSSGIAFSTFRTGVVIRNGTVRNFPNHGISARIDAGRIENIVTSGNGGWGIENTGGTFSTTIIGCVAIANSGGGIHGGSTAVITESIARNNGGNGIQTGNSSRVTGCTSRSNAQNGFLVGDNSSISECIAAGNTENGFSIARNATVNASTSSNNQASGFSATANASFLNSTAAGNGSAGFELGIGSSATNCTARENGFRGFTATRSCTITGCTAIQNTDAGIRAGSGCVITDSASDGNTSHGILIESTGNTVRNNTARNNGVDQDGGGVRVVAERNRLEDNHVANNTVGIWVTSPRNTVIANSASDNLFNYVISPGNRYGPIINHTSTATSSASGNSASGTMSTSDPHANFAN